MSGRPERMRDWQCAEGFYNGKTFGFFSMSGWGPRGVDSRGAVHFLPANSSNRAVGKAMTDCLNHSRYLPKGEERDYFFSKAGLKDNEIWEHRQLVAGMNAKNFKELKEKLMLITIDSGLLLSESAYADRIKPSPGDNMTIKPSKNENGNGWDNTADYYGSMVKLKYPCPPEELGTLIREAFKRCEGVGREQIEFPEPLSD